MLMMEKIEELVELVVNVSDPSEEGCHCHEQRCILSLEKPRHGANGNAQNTNVNRIGTKKVFSWVAKLS